MGLEKYIVPWNVGECDASIEAVKFAIKSRNEGIPTAFVRKDNKWYILHSGQGPYVAWREE